MSLNRLLAKDGINTLTKEACRFDSCHPKTCRNKGLNSPISLHSYDIEPESTLGEEVSPTLELLHRQAEKFRFHSNLGNNLNNSLLQQLYPVKNRNGLVIEVRKWEN